MEDFKKCVRHCSYELLRATALDIIIKLENIYIKKTRQ